MKNRSMRLHILSVWLILLLSFGMAWQGNIAFAETPITVTLDGEALSFDQPPIITNDRTMVPLRGIFEALGYTLFWDQETATATAQNETAVLTVEVGSKTLYKNGQGYSFDVPPINVSGRVLVPIRAVAELSGCSVSWLETSRTVMIERGALPSGIDLGNIPPYCGEPYTVVNGNVPRFTSAEITEVPFESYSELDSLGRCGTAFANICKELMPNKERGSIGMIKPSGWQTVKYENIEGKYLYNRCHLIGYQLAGENANERNLITGTRYLNMSGMLPFENKVDDYVKKTGHHVLYRVTPLFKGNNLLADGVLMEAYSVEDGGAGISFCVFCYNVQPGITIDYATGESYANDGSVGLSGGKIVSEGPPEEESGYIGNGKSKVFHLPTCSSVSRMSEENKVPFTTREEAAGEGYTPCQICNP